MWPLLQRRRDGLARLGAHHVFVCTSATEPERVLVSMALHTREPVAEVLRSKAFFEWFDAVGVEDLPAVFAGELLERIECVEDGAAALPGVVVVGITAVDDVAALCSHVRDTRELFCDAGIQRVWIFEAFVDPHEVMFSQELADEEAARRWLSRPDTAAKWLSDAGVGAYPSVFVGSLAHVMRVAQTGEAQG